MSDSPKLWASIIGSDAVGSVFLTKDEAADEANMHASMCLSNVADGGEGEAWYRAIDQYPDMEKVGFALPFGEGLNFCAPVEAADGVQAVKGKEVFVLVERKVEEAERDGACPFIAATRVLAFATRAAADEREKNPPAGWDKSRHSRVRMAVIGKGERYF